MSAVIEVGFDYAVIDADGRDDVKEAAVRIRLRMSRTVEDIIEIGRDLTNVKKAIGHGHFLRWIEAEFGMSDSTAQNFINVAKRFGDKFPTVGNIAPAVLYALAAPSTDDAVVDEVVERVEAGEKVTTDDVKSLKAEWASERKDLKKQLDEQKLKARDEASSKADFAHQLQQLRSEMATLRDERDTMAHDVERLRNGAVGVVKTVEAYDDREAHESQVKALVNAWNKASKEAREDFLSRIDAPVMDHRFGSEVAGRPFGGGAS